MDPTDNGDLVLDTARLPTSAAQGPWPTLDPFLFCAHHLDAYPAGDGRLGPAGTLDGRAIGSDFAAIDGWNMYHGDSVPGFPAHPHRGFETVTVVRTGLVDHSDSLGATCRYGEGDVQWLTAAGGVVHAEMFPLVRTEADNPLELFQIWLNLPAASKTAAPHFQMLWADTIPLVEVAGDGGARAEVLVVAGRFGDAVPPTPPPESWARREESDVAIWVLEAEAGASVELPSARPGTIRAVYVHGTGAVRITDGAGRGPEVPAGRVAVVRAERPAVVTALDDARVLVLQGRPIGEPVARYGPFVMTTEDEIHQAFADYRATGFGGWPWSDDGPTHGSDAGRFAVHPDGTLDEPVR